jgi:hypothetical protein
VVPFKSADERFAQEPAEFLETYFHQDKRRVSEIAGNADGMTVNTDAFIEHGINISLLESQLGVCTDRHRDVVYDRGHSAPAAITLARLASRLVDAPKQGFQIKLDKWSEILSRLKVRPPEYVRPKGERRVTRLANVMDVLVLQVIPTFRDEVMISFNTSLNSKTTMQTGIPLDEDIKEFYMAATREYPEAVAGLRKALGLLSDEWLNFFSRNQRDQALNKDYKTCSPKKGLSRSVSRIDRSSLV